MISVVPHNFHRIEVVVVARKESQPAVQAASCAGCELCGREPALPASSTDARTLQCLGVISFFLLSENLSKVDLGFGLASRRLRNIHVVCVPAFFTAV